ncbi:methionine aminopeptidase, type I [Leptonema illini DSM 21528]|uniref:Methionine aminopeptidase n=1 Tax=Leptonema illini DSM 21528 TaxID=929563 RepID=H2CF04_9LEPT|nr:methionine aminopeptidase, type I [Leptonema illini DSM 21528]
MAPGRKLTRREQKVIHIKSKLEIEKMRDAGKLAAEVLFETGQRVKAGVSTEELNDFAHSLTLKRGAESAPLNYRGFPKSICTSVNEVVCHGIPTKNEILKEGDILNIDITVKLRGFHGDTSAMFAVGNIPENARKLIENTEKAMWAGIEVVKPGKRISDIGQAIDDFLTPQGYGIVRALAGHGIGRKFHEEPLVPHYKNNEVRVPIRPGMTFTVEPMVNEGTYRVIFDESDGWTVRTADGRLSAQFEHTCLVTDDGVEVLTRWG